MPFKVELGVEKYRIIGPKGQEGLEVEYDTIATLKIGDELYYCDVQFDPTDSFPLESQEVERVSVSYPEETTTDQVLFEGEVEDEREGPDEEDDEEEPGPTLVS